MCGDVDRLVECVIGLVDYLTERSVGDVVDLGARVGDALISKFLGRGLTGALISAFLLKYAVPELASSSIPESEKLLHASLAVTRTLTNVVACVLTDNYNDVRSAVIASRLLLDDAKSILDALVEKIVREYFYSLAQYALDVTKIVFSRESESEKTEKFSNIVDNFLDLRDRMITRLSKILKIVNTIRGLEKELEELAKELEETMKEAGKELEEINEGSEEETVGESSGGS